jgi:signal-transduction protein with cAMP-binding, CBS, and nucleotidyltransferase domain
MSSDPSNPLAAADAAPPGSAQPVPVEGPTPRPGTQARGRESALFRYLFRRQQRPLTNLEFLAGIPLFESLSRRELKRVAGIVHERTYAAGELIFEQGTPGAVLFLIKRGAVELFRQDATGHELVKLSTLQQGMFFGEGALLHEENRLMSARALDPTDLLALFRGDLDQIIESAPSTGGKILRKLAWVLSRRLQTAMEEHFRER